MKKTSPRSVDRRKFLKTSATAAAGFFIVPRHVLGRGFIAPSDKLNIAVVGVAGIGGMHISSLKDTENLVAFCDVDDRKAKKVYEEFPNTPKYKDFRKMLDTEGKNIDAVIVGTPDHSHTVIGLAVMQAGKHLFLQKPLAHSVSEVRALLEASRKYKVVTQMGNQGASMDCNRSITEWIQAGTIGEVRRAHVWTNRPVWPQGLPTPVAPEAVPSELDWDLWLGPAAYRPYSSKYMPFNWRGWWEFGTGALGDMGCHLLDPAYRALKLTVPTSVEANATTVWSDFFVESNYPDSCPPSSVVKMDFPAREGMPECELIWYDGGIKPMRPAELGPNEEFGSWSGGVIFEGSKGKIICGEFGDGAVLLPTSRMKDFTPPKPWLKREKHEKNHPLVWAEACKGIGAATSPFEYACPLTETLLIGNLAVRMFDVKYLKAGKTPTSWAPYDYPGRVRMLWDSKSMRITNCEEANKFVNPTYRDGWSMAV